MIAAFRQLALGAFGMTLLTGIALAAPSRPVLLATGQPGVGTDGPFTLLVALPLNNVGTDAAQNLTVTAVSLANSTQLSPALPAVLGTVPAQGGIVFNVQFDRTALVAFKALMRGNDAITARNEVQDFKNTFGGGNGRSFHIGLDVDSTH